MTYRSHTFLTFWITPWSWERPKWRRWSNGDWTLCFGFGQLERITD